MANAALRGKMNPLCSEQYSKTWVVWVVAAALVDLQYQRNFQSFHVDLY